MAAAVGVQLSCFPSSARRRVDCGRLGRRACQGGARGEIREGGEERESVHSQSTYIIKLKCMHFLMYFRMRHSEADAPKILRHFRDTAS